MKEERLQEESLAFPLSWLWLQSQKEADPRGAMGCHRRAGNLHKIHSQHMEYREQTKQNILQELRCVELGQEEDRGNRS